MKLRILEGAGFVNPSSLPRGPNGLPLCRWCGRECPSKRHTFCGGRKATFVRATGAIRTPGEGCVHEHCLRSQPGYARRLVFARDRGVCALCGVQCGDAGQPYWQADHIVPVVEGGGACGLENLRTLCEACHKGETKKLARRRAEARRAARAGVVATALAALLLTGCAATVARDTQTAVSVVTDDASKKALDALGESVAAAARDRLLDEETTQKVQALARVLFSTLEAEVATSSALLREQVRQAVAELRASLGDAARAVVRQAIDEALSQTTLAELDVARAHEREGLRQDLVSLTDSVAEEVASKVSGKLTVVQAQADAEGAKLARYGLAAAGVIAALLALFGVVTYRHRTRIKKLEARLGALEVP